MPTARADLYTLPSGGDLFAGYADPGTVAPVAEFSGVPTSGLVPLAVAFTNESIGSYSAVLWDFGDGTTSSSANPTHNYAAAGNYTVSLTLSWVGGSVVRTRTAYVTASAVSVSSLTLHGPIFGSVGSPATGSVENTGTIAQNWTLTATPAAPISPSSGSTPAGGSTSFAVTAAAAGSYSISLANTSGGAVVGSPDMLIVSVPSASSAAARSAGNLLFQPSQQSRTYAGHTYTHEASTGINNSGLMSAAPTFYAVDEFGDWMWTNPGGDWIDASGTPQGTNHFVTFPMNSGSFTIYPNINVTSLVQFVQQQNRWNAWIIGEAGSAERTIGGLHNTDPAKRPALTVTYTDGQIVDLPCRITAGRSSGSNTPRTFAATYGLPCFVEFDRPTKAVQSATLSLYGDFQWSGTSPISINPLNPPTNAADMGGGVAVSYPLDVGLMSEPGVVFAHNLADGTPSTDVISPILSNMLDTPDMDPKLWNDALAADTSKLPWTAQNKWINASYTGPTDPVLELVPSTYTGAGFVPLAPGLGALHCKIQKKPGFADGVQTDSSGQTGAIARMFLPFDDMGIKDHLRSRFGFRVHFERDLVWEDRIIAPNIDGLWQATNFTGKFGPGYCHDTSEFGFSGSSGSGGGWQWRKQWGKHLHGFPLGPAEGLLALGTHIKSDFKEKSPISYENTRENWGDNGSYGAAVRQDQWYWIEDEFILNSLTSSGLGYNADGVYRVWMAPVGQPMKLVFERTGLAIRSNPVHRGSIGVPVAVPGGGNTGSVTFAHNMGSPYSPQAAIPETITLTFDGGGGYTAVGSFYGTYAPGTVGTAYTSARRHKWTITGTPGAGDTLVITFPPGAGGGRTAIRELGVRDIMINMFHGGKTETPVDIDFFISCFAYGYGDEMAGPFGPVAGVGGVTPSGSVTLLGSPNSAHDLSTLEEISPKYQSWNPNIGSIGPWGGTAGPVYDWHTTFAYCGIAWDSHSRQVIGFGAGHVACCVPVPWAFDVDSATYSWLDVPPPTDAFSLCTLEPNATNLAAAYPSGQLDATRGEWQGDWAGWPSGFARPGRIFPEPGHSRSGLVFIPPAAAGNSNGILLPCTQPSGNLGDPTSARNQHYFDFDDGRWKRTVNKCATGSTICGGAAYLPGVQRAVSITSNGTAYRSLVDVFDGITKTWSQVSCTSSFGGLPITPEYGGIVEHEASGLVLAFCPTNAGGTVVAENATKQRIWSVAASSLVAGSSTWLELTVTVASWPLLMPPTVAGSSANTMTIGWAYCPRNGKFYATDGRHNSTTLWVLSPPAGAVTLGDHQSGTWTITTETLSQPISSRRSDGNPHASSVFNRLQWDAGARAGLGALIYVEEYVNAQVQHIVPNDL